MNFYYGRISFRQNSPQIYINIFVFSRGLNYYKIKYGDMQPVEIKLLLLIIKIILFYFKMDASYFSVFHFK